MGFFADVGPLSVFVSHQVSPSFLVCTTVHPLDRQTCPATLQLIHPELKFDPNSNPPSFASEDQVSASLFYVCMPTTPDTSADNREKHPRAPQDCRDAC